MKNTKKHCISLQNKKYDKENIDKHCITLQNINNIWAKKKGLDMDLAYWKIVDKCVEYCRENKVKIIN